MSSSKEKLNRAYLETKVNRILEPMVLDIVASKPDRPVFLFNIQIEFMISWLKEHYGNRASVHANERFELEFLRKECKKLKEELGVDDDANSAGSEMCSDESDDDYVDHLPLPVPAKAKAARTSVSAEVYGTWNIKGNWHPIVIPKSEDAKQKIAKRLNQAFMFSGLTPQELKIVIDAMDEKRP
jgi:hypothetical protein